MLQATVIGNLGATAEVKSVDGRKFITFRVADTRSWTDAQGQRNSQTIWIDCTMNYGESEPAILKYLVSGQTVYIQGSVSLRVYSSQKDRCMKAGMTIHVREIELIGGSPDAIPKVLYTQDGVQVDVTKWYYAGGLRSQYLMSRSGGMFTVDAAGWVSKMPDAQDKANAAGQQSAGNATPTDQQSAVNATPTDQQSADNATPSDQQPADNATLADQQPANEGDAPFTGTDTQEQIEMNKTTNRRRNGSK